MDWKKLLGDMAVLSDKPVNEGFLAFAMYLDLYKSTNNLELKKELEELFSRMIRATFK